MGRIAGEYCERIILTNEDPYDEDPQKIIDDVARGVEDESKVTIIMDRRKAIHTALEEAPDGSVVLISGKDLIHTLWDPTIPKLHGVMRRWYNKRCLLFSETLCSARRWRYRKPAHPKDGRAFFFIPQIPYLFSPVFQIFCAKVHPIRTTKRMTTK